jgi:hypothetical protein
MHSVQLREALFTLLTFSPEIIEVSLRLFIFIRPECAYAYLLKLPTNKSHKLS